jgi:hypothetical protein
MDRRRPAGARALLLSAALLAAAGCSVGKDAKPGRDVSSFKLEVGDCVVPPTEIKAELSKVRVVNCATRHTQEAYALVDYAPADGASPASVYPGDDVLKKFADGACAQRYEGYVGVAYADSKLFFTYLLPSARGWQGGDRSVVCFVTTTGGPLTKSVKGSKT